MVGTSRRPRRAIVQKHRFQSAAVTLINSMRATVGKDKIEHVGMKLGFCKPASRIGRRLNGPLAYDSLRELLNDIRAITDHHS